MPSIWDYPPIADPAPLQPSWRAALQINAASWLPDLETTPASTRRHGDADAGDSVRRLIA